MQFSTLMVALVLCLAMSANASEVETLRLEEQIQKLSELGISLNEGVSIDDLLISFSREEYEQSPYDLILFVYGIEIEVEPWGRYFSDRAWNFDVEAIEGDGSYVEIVRQFHRITGNAKRLENLFDEVDLESGRARVSYEIDGLARAMEPKIDNDWADPQAVEMIMKDLAEPGFSFYAKDNGQASIWFYLDEDQARALDELANGIFGLRPWWKFW